MIDDARSDLAEGYVQYSVACGLGKKEGYISKPSSYNSYISNPRS